MTNGGGITEAERCQKLSRQLDVQVDLTPLPTDCTLTQTTSKLSSTQLVQAHTILKELKHKYADKPVLILGGRGNKGREVAERWELRLDSFPVMAYRRLPKLWVSTCVHNSGFTDMGPEVCRYCRNRIRHMR